ARARTRLVRGPGRCGRRQVLLAPPDHDPSVDLSHRDLAQTTALVEGDAAGLDVVLVAVPGALERRPARRPVLAHYSAVDAGHQASARQPCSLVQAAVDERPQLALFVADHDDG